MSTIGWGLLVVLGGLAALLGWQWRTAAAGSERLAGALDDLGRERDDLQAQLAREREARKRQGDELATLRNRADKARRREARSEKGAGDRPIGTATRMADLETRVAATERERDRFRAERERLAVERDRLAAERERLVAELSRLEAERAEAVGATPSDVVPDAGPHDTPFAAQAATVALEEQLAKLNEALEGARQTEARMRKRVSNQEQLYASLRAELEVKKDLIRTQEEQIRRLEALRAAIVD